MAPTIVDMAAELEASPRLHTIEAVTVELADVTIDAGPQWWQARHDAFHMQLMAGLMNQSWV